MKREHEGFIRLFRVRDYDSLPEYADTQIRKNGWPKLADRIEEIRKKARPVVDDLRYWRSGQVEFPNHQELKYLWPELPDPRYSHRVEKKKTPEVPNVSPGAIRDGLLHILSLENVAGIDTNLHESFGKIKCKDLAGLQAQSTKVASNILASQIKEFNTYFISLEELRKSRFVGFVPEVVESRKIEIEKLGERVSIKQASETYYGLLVLTHIAEKTKGGGIDDDARTGLERTLSKERGHSIEVKPNPSRVEGDFKNCTRPTRNLLRMIQWTYTAGTHRRCENIDKLGTVGDGRLVPWLLARLEVVSGVRVRPKVKLNYRGSIHPDLIYTHEVDALLGALGRIGTSDCYDAVIDYVRDDVKSAVWALGGIRHPDVLDSLLALTKSGNEELARVAFANIWRVETDQARRTLSTCLQDSSCKFRTEALRTLVLGDLEFKECVEEHPTSVASILIESPEISLDAFECHPDLKNLRAVQDAIVDVVRSLVVNRKGRRKLIELIGKHPDTFTKTKELRTIVPETIIELRGIPILVHVIIETRNSLNNNEMVDIIEANADEVIDKLPRYVHQWDGYSRPPIVKSPSVSDAVARSALEILEKGYKVPGDIIDNLLKYAPRTAGRSALSKKVNQIIKEREKKRKHQERMRKKLGR